MSRVAVKPLEEYAMRQLATVVTSCFFILIAACSSSTGNLNSKTTGRELKLAFVTNNSSDFWTIARRGVEKADNELPEICLLYTSDAADE